MHTLKNYFIISHYLKTDIVLHMLQQCKNVQQCKLGSSDKVSQKK